MKAQHRIKRHNRRVAHQRIMRRKKLQAIASCGDLPRKQMIEAMDERGYFYNGDEVFRKTGNVLPLSDPKNWKRRPQENTEKPKVNPGSGNKK